MAKINAPLVKSANLIAHCESKVIFSGSVPRISMYSTKIEMKDSFNSDIRLKLIMALWSLLFTKCFFLEFLVRHYAVPINSLYYVWALSILMAAVATTVYAELQIKERVKSIRRPNSFFVLMGNIITVLFVISALIAPEKQSHIALVLAALIVTAQHTWLWIGNLDKSYRMTSWGWLLGVIAITSLGSPAGFLVFSICMLTLSAAPSLARFLALRKAMV